MIYYLASPYSHPDNTIEEERYQETLNACATLLAQGFHVYSPVVHCHNICKKYALPGTFDFWKAYNHAFLAVSDVLVLLKLTDWENSIGMKEEELFFRTHFIGRLIVDYDNLIKG